MSAANSANQPPAASPGSAPSGRPDTTRQWPTRQDFAFGLGGLLENWGLVGLKNTANQVLNIVLEVNPAVIGTTFAIMRLWDAFSDPIVGNISDNLRSRWGRRRPLIAAGALLCGLIFPLIWWLPAKLSVPGQFAWLLFAGIAFYTAHALFSVPYQAFGYEIAPGYNEKTRLFATRSAIGTLHGLIVAWIFPLIVSGFLGSPRESVHILAVILASGFALTGCLPAVLVRDRIVETTVARQPKIPLRTALSVALSSPNFIAVASAASLTIASLNAVTILGMYVNIYYVHGGNATAASVVGGIQFTVSVIFILLCTPFMTGLSKVFGKRTALMLCILMAILGTISKWFCYTPAHPYWIIGVVFLLGPANAGLRIFADAMVGDVCEYERATSGVRMEGVFGAVYAWMLKVGLALAVLLSGFILTWAGFDVKHGPAQDPATLLYLRLLFSFFPLVALAIGCILLARYRLTPKIMAEVREKLDRQEAVKA